VNHSDYSVERQIGEGAFGVVTKSKWLGCDVAVKRLGKDFHSLTSMYKEVRFLNRLRHPQIVQVVGVSLPTNSFRGLWSGDIIMELMDGDLRTLIEKRMEEKKGQGVPFNQREAIDIIIQIARAIQHLHMKGCMHRDIKCLNILFNDHGSYVDVKISDFGVSSQVAREDVYTSKDTYTSRRGTVGWMAPEVGDTDGQTVHGYSAKADIYSFGITCYEILTGNRPYPDIPSSKFHSNIMAGHRPMLPFDIGGKLRDLIQD
jgi:serine/threonine protein kinase